RQRRRAGPVQEPGRRRAPPPDRDGDARAARGRRQRARGPRMSAQSAAAPDTTGTVFEEDVAEVTRAYAEAIVNAAETQGEVEGVLGDLDEIAFRLLPAHRQFASLLSSPLVSAADK